MKRLVRRLFNNAIRWGSGTRQAYVSPALTRGERRGCYRANMKKGDLVENFVLDSSSGESVSLDSLVEHGPVVLYFYIKAFTPG